MELKELRESLGITQPEAASLIGIPMRTYFRYENEPKYIGTFKYNQMLSILNSKASEIVLDIPRIKKIVSEIVSKYKTHVCYLFGSYAKGCATGISDVDLLILTDTNGLQFYTMLGELQEALHKHVDLIRVDAAVQNVQFLNEVLIDGIKIYQQNK